MKLRVSRLGNSVGSPPELLASCSSCIKIEEYQSCNDLHQMESKSSVFYREFRLQKTR